MDTASIPEGRLPMGPDRIRQAIVPLRLIFWGGLLCIFDIAFTTRVNGQGFKFDILNDAVGMILITVGVFKLGAIPVHARYATAMTFVKVISVLAVADAVRDHFVMELPDVVVVGLQLLGLLGLAAIVVFCVAMRWFCQTARLPAAARSWKVTMILFVVIYLAPLGLFYLAAGAAVLTGESFNINLGPAGLLLLPVFAAPIIHLFISTSRMKRGAEAMPDVAGQVVAPPE
jgi:hypothetical protein